MKNTIIIEPEKGMKVLKIKELLRYKDLLYFMVLRDITVMYKQSILGYAWAIINPLFSMIVFSIIFGKLANMPSDGIPYPIFSYAAMLPWSYFAATLSGSTNSLISKANMINKVYFPRIIIPLTPALAKMADFFIAFSILIVMMFYFKIYPDLNLIYLPLLILLMFMSATGLGMWFSALAIQYRDVKFAISFVEKILMYLAPVVFPASLIADKFGEKMYYLYGLYPMAGCIEGFRSCLLGQTDMPWALIGIGSLSTLAIFISGLFYFQKMEKVFADVA